MYDKEQRREMLSTRLKELQAQGSSAEVNRCKADIALVDHYDDARLDELHRAVHDRLVAGRVLEAIEVLMNSVAVLGEKKAAARIVDSAINFRQVCKHARDVKE